MSSSTDIRSGFGGVREPPGPGSPRLPLADWPIHLTVLGLFAGLMLGAGVLPVPVSLLDPGLDTYAGLISAQLLLEASFLGTALVVAGVARGRGAALARLGVGRIPWRAASSVLSAFLGYLAFLVLYSVVVGSPDQKDLGRELGLGAGGIVAALSVLLLAGLAPFSEELFFRGMFFGGLRVRFSFWPAALLSGIVFGSLHLTTGVSTVPPLAVFGVLLAWTYERSGSLWPAVALHVLNNSLALAVS